MTNIDNSQMYSGGEIEEADSNPVGAAGSIIPYINMPRTDLTEPATNGTQEQLEPLQEQVAHISAATQGSSVEEESTRRDELIKEEVVRAPHSIIEWLKFFLPLVAFAAGVVAITTSSLLLTHSTDEIQSSSTDGGGKQYEDDDMVTVADANKDGSLCLWQLNKRFLGTDAFRLQFGAPQLKATQWLAVQDHACSSMGVNSTQMEQRYAVMVLYFAVGGKEWRTWAQPGISECGWQYVGCNAESQVTHLHIEKAKAGRLPDEIGLLSSLTFLHLSRNSFKGTLPMALYSLTKLVALHLSGNQFVGSLHSDIGSLTDLEHLVLGQNKLTGTMPSSLGSLTRLKTVDTNLNEIESFELWSLTRFWPELERLLVQENNIDGSIPSEIGLLSNLQFLSLDRATITGTLPTEIGLLTSLFWLTAAGVKFDGSVLPSEIGHLSVLDQLDIRDTNMVGVTIPTEFGLCTSLALLRLGNCGLVGSIPSELGQLTGLKELWFDENDLTGSLPMDLYALTRLEIMDLSRNTWLEPISLSFCDIVQTLRADCKVYCECCERLRC